MGSVLNGLVTFVDASQLDGFAAAAGQAGLAATSDEVSTPLPVSVRVSLLQVRVALAASGVTVTLLKNDVVTTLTCTTSAGTCSATVGSPVAFAPGDRISVEVRHTSGLLRGVRWSIVLGA